MSILIKGMEMPTSCDCCPLCGCFVLDDGTEENYRCCATMRVLTKFDKRDERCPLIELPPHGRLIDADELKLDLTRFYDGEVTAKRLIDEQPTIIPAEENNEVYESIPRKENEDN